MSNELTPREIFEKRLWLVKRFAERSGCTVFNSEENLDLVADVFYAIRKLFKKLGDTQTNSTMLFFNEKRLLLDVLTVVFGNIGVATANDEWSKDIKQIFTEDFLKYITVFLEEN